MKFIFIYLLLIPLSISHPTIYLYEMIGIFIKNYFKKINIFHNFIISIYIVIIIIVILYSKKKMINIRNNCATFIFSLNKKRIYAKKNNFYNIYLLGRYRR